jgi:hypothetical protein
MPVCVEVDEARFLASLQRHLHSGWGDRAADGQANATDPSDHAAGASSDLPARFVALVLQVRRTQPSDAV